MLGTGIDSLEKLAIVVELRRLPGRQMSLAELRSITGMDRDDLRTCLGQLGAAGFLQGSGDKVVLAQRSAAEEAVLDEIVAIHDQDKTQLIIAITEIAMDNLRNLAGKAFADAFLLRKKSGDDHG